MIVGTRDIKGFISQYPSEIVGLVLIELAEKEGLSD